MSKYNTQKLKYEAERALLHWMLSVFLWSSRLHHPRGNFPCGDSLHQRTLDGLPGCQSHHCLCPQVQLLIKGIPWGQVIYFKVFYVLCFVCLKPFRVCVGQKEIESAFMWGGKKKFSPVYSSRYPGVFDTVCGILCDNMQSPGACSSELIILPVYSGLCSETQSKSLTAADRECAK